jgi:hypothetical protein
MYETDDEAATALTNAPNARPLYLAARLENAPAVIREST